MRAGYVHIEDDTQGPNVLLCEACIEADGHDAPEMMADWDGRCACCGSTAGYTVTELEPESIDIGSGPVGGWEHSA